MTLLSCGNDSSINKDSIIGLEFKKFDQIENLSNYTRVSDTVIYGNGNEPKYGILHLLDKDNNLIVFKSIVIDLKKEDRIFKILDTLIIPNKNESDFVTVGYCQFNKDNDENLIALVEKTDSLSIQKIKKVWKANTTSGKIENVNNFTKIKCLNEKF